MLHPILSLTARDFWQPPKQTGDVGVEIELEGTNLPIEIQGWVTKAENSLRGLNGRAVHPNDNAPDTPREYVTRGAVSLQTLRTRLNTLSAALREKNVEVRLVSRASTHIHVNMQQQSLRSILGYFIVYSMIEPVLVRLCGPERNGNLFCLPNFETGDMPSTVAGWAQHLTLKSPHWGSRGKYAALNSDPLQTFGSVEIRCFPVSTDPDTIMRWASWVTNIRNKAEQCQDETYKSLIDYVWKYPASLAWDIFTDHPGGIAAAVRPNDVEELIRKGVEGAYEIYRAAKPVFDWHEKKAKPRSKKPYIDTIDEAAEWEVRDEPQVNFADPGRDQWADLQLRLRTVRAR
jgi:Putative amidoligase enzyme.